MPMMSKMITAFLIAVAFVLPGALGCDRESKQEASKKDEKIIIAVTPWAASAALFIAREKGYFQDEGIDADFHSYISGHLGLDAVLSGKADLATAGDTPIARAAVAGKPVVVIATLCEINRAVLVVARKDRGISSPADLRGKKVGVVAGTTADFFLHILLTTSYINPKDVGIVNLATDQVIDALVSGEVDAVSTWSPHTIAARDKLGDNGVVIEDPSIYKMTWNIMSTKEVAGANPERIRRVLRAIVRANEFIIKHPGEARAVTSKNIGTNSPFFEKEWADYTFIAELDQSLLLNLEDQARWMIKQGVGDDRGTPNLMDFIYTDGLEAVQPEALGFVNK